MSLLSSLARLSVSAALLCAAALPLAAADLPRAEYYGEAPYDDPRYGDIYRVPAPPPPPARYGERYPDRPGPYVERYAEPAPPRAWRDDRGGYLPEMPPPGAWREPGSYGRYGSAGSSCLPPPAVRSALQQQGWRGFQDMELRGNVVLARAWRAGGQLFDITVDRCSGQVLEARPADRRAAEAWRYRDGVPGY